MEISLRFPLQEIIFNALLGTISELQLRELTRLFRAFAFPIVHNKVRAGKLSLDYVGLSESDIVLDCIAELFRRNENNQLVELANYFERQHITIGECSEEKLMMSLRRLVIRVVTDNVFRIYNEVDPALGKILRNLKLAVEKSKEFYLAEFLGEQFLVVHSSEPLLQKRTIDTDELQIVVESNLETGDDVPEFLTRLAGTLTTQEQFQRKVKLISLAVALKIGFERIFTGPEAYSDSIHSTFLVNDVKETILSVCKSVCAEMKPRYVQKKKMDEKQFHLYFEVIRELLESEFLDERNGIPSHYERLQEILPDLTKADYTKHHRIIFEYLVKLSRERAKEKLKTIAF
ncbi:MAG: hypothetical protein KGZ58_03450 [Ignavibacteriales bacterium]|nr:hypothetical protein [Ignavibacteriales bacterium]